MTSKTYEGDVPEGIIFRLVGDGLRYPDQLYRKIGQTTKIICDEYGTQIGAACPVFPDSECVKVGFYEEDTEMGNEEAIVMGVGYPHFPITLTSRTSMSANEFSFMQATVDELVRSMDEEPHKWTIANHTLNHKGVAYWIGGMGYGKYITEIWDGRDTRRVFSSSQGRQLGDAFQRLRAVKVSEAQRFVLERANPKSIWQRFVEWMS